MSAQPPRRQDVAGQGFQGVVVALRGAALVVVDLGLAGGAVPARCRVGGVAHARGAQAGQDRFELGPHLRGDQAGDGAHPVAALPADDDAAPPGPVLVGVAAVGVEVVADPPGQAGQLFGAEPAAQLGELGRGLLTGPGIHPRRQVGHEAADDADLRDAQPALALRGGRLGQQRGQRLAGQRPTRAQVGGLGDAQPGLAAGDQQPLGQPPGQLATQLRRGRLGGDRVDQPMLTGGQPAPQPLVARQHRQPAGSGQRFRVDTGQPVQGGIDRIEGPNCLFGLDRMHVSMIERPTDNPRPPTTTKTPVTQVIPETEVARPPSAQRHRRPPPPTQTPISSVRTPPRPPAPGSTWSSGGARN